MYQHKLGCVEWLLVGFCYSSMNKHDAEEAHEVYKSTNQDHFGLLWKIPL
jgi:hypothetical protein